MGRIFLPGRRPKPTPQRFDLETNPDAFWIPIPAAFVLTPAIFFVVVIGPLPFVGINANTELRLVIVLLLHVPAVAYLIANDGC